MSAKAVVRFGLGVLKYVVMILGTLALLNILMVAYAYLAGY